MKRKTFPSDITLEAIVHDVRVALRLARRRDKQSNAAKFDRRISHLTPESGRRAGYDGHQCKRGSTMHVAVDALGHVQALSATPANEQDRVQVEEPARHEQDVTGQAVDVAFVDQGNTEEAPARAAHCQGRELQVIKVDKKGFVLLPQH